MASPTGLLSEGLISNAAPSFQQPPQLQNNPAAVLCGKGPDPETRFIESSPLPSASSFRNVSACHRCRMRKHRCDQQLPKCQSCEKAQVRCVGYDPITKKEIPRSYVYFLETRVQYLNDILLKHNIDFNIGAASDDDGPHIEATTTAMFTSPVKTEISNSNDRIPGDIPRSIEPAQLDNSLDCVVFDLLAGKETKKEITRMDDSNGFPTSLSTSLHSPLFRFGIESPAKEYMELPDRDIADQLVDEYFIHTNLHVPVLNRPDFERNLNRIYSNKKTNHPKDKLFFVFIVLAIGAASVSRTHQLTSSSGSNFDRSGVRSKKRKRSSIHLQAADEFHASAMACWENCLDSHGNIGLFGDFDGLQAVILLCSFALFKSTSPGLGKLLDIAIRTAIDLRLYSEDENSITNLMKFDSKSPTSEVHCDWVQDLRRRLWWCIYSLDRLVAPYLERPFFIPDDVITTKFPSVLDDRFITRCGILTSVGDPSAYKPTVQHRFKFRILQSEIHTVIQYQQSLSRRGGVLPKCNRKLPSYMTGFSSFSSWRHNIYCRLQDWRKSMPTFGPLSDRFLMELDFWQSIIALYRWSVKIPTDLVRARAMNNVTTQLYFDETQEQAECICFKVAEASSNALHIHHMMQNIGNATAPYLTAHEVFVAVYFFSQCGIPYLFEGNWYDPLIAKNLSPTDELQTFRSLDYSTLAAISTLDRLKDKCGFAKRATDTLRAMTTLTMELKLSTADLMAPHSCSMNATTFNEAFSTEHAAQNQNFETPQPRGHTLKNAHSIEKVPPLYPNPGPDFASFAYHHENLIPGPPDESLIYSSDCAKSPGGLDDGKASNSSQSEDIAVLREVLSSPESLQSWNGSDIQTSNCLPDNWCQIMKPLTPQIPTRSILESADIQDSEDFLDAYIAGLT